MAEDATITATAEDRAEALQTLAWAQREHELVDWSLLPVGVRKAAREILKGESK